MTETTGRTAGMENATNEMGQKMKNLGLRSGLQLRGMAALIWSVTLASLWATAGNVVRPGTRIDTRPPDHPERGDVPGWVMITLMSAVLVAALLALAGPALESMFNQAMDKVGN